MKYILMIVLVAAIMLISQGVCKQYRERYTLFEALSEFLRQMRLNLSFQKQKIKEILNRATIRKTSKEIYMSYLSYLEDGTSIDLGFIKVLDETEKEQITNMLLSLGKNDTSGELKQLDAYDVYLQDKLQAAKAEKDKNCPLITKLSLLFAIGLAILLI